MVRAVVHDQGLSCPTFIFPIILVSFIRSTERREDKGSDN